MHSRVKMVNILQIIKQKVKVLKKLGKRHYILYQLSSIM